MTVRALAAGAFALAAGVASFADGQAKPLPRVVSTTLCGDQYIMALADRSQIVSLSEQAAGPVSMHAREAKSLPHGRIDVERLLDEHADLILIEPGSRIKYAAAMQEVGLHTLMLPGAMVSSFDEIDDGVRRVAAALGHPDRGEALIAHMHARIARLKRAQPAPDKRPVALYLVPGNGGAAKGTYVNLALELAGFRNQQALQGQKGWARNGLEQIVAHPPQIFITSFFDTQSDSLQASAGIHPLLGRLNAPVESIPGKYWICASPTIIDAAEMMAAARIRDFPWSRVEADAQ